MTITRVRSSLRASLSIGIAIVLAAGVALTGAAPASAQAAHLCSGYVACAALGMSNHGYSSASRNWYWQMYPGHNCTNYAAYMMVKAGLPNVRPWTNATGNAAGWGVGMADITNSRPAAGSIAWWTGGAGHVAYVEAVISSSEIMISEDSWGGDFHWRIINKNQGGWPNGFIHFKDAADGGSVPDWRAKPQSTTVFTDATRSKIANLSMMKPGSSAWVDLNYVNTGTEKWVGKRLATSDRAASPFAAPTWQSTVVPVAQSQAEVAPGATATFSFPIVIPAGVADGTQIADVFEPVGAAGVRIPYGKSTVSLTADSRSLFSSTPTPKFSGTLAEGQTLTASAGTWSPSTGTTLAYAWRRDGVVIPGATAKTHVLTGADVGRKMSVSVTATAPKYIPATTTSLPSATIVTSQYPSNASTGVKLEANAQLVSTNGRYRLLQKTTGSLVVQDRFTARTLWSNNQINRANNSVLTAKGSLASYSTAGTLTWKTATANKGVVNIAISNTGKLLLRTADRKVIWTSS